MSNEIVDLDSAYQAIQGYYGDKRAERSGFLYMRHIDQIHNILDEIGSSDITKAAYCLHPIFQIEEKPNDFVTVDTAIRSLATEYAQRANAYLSNLPEIPNRDVLISPRREISEMLLADKAQNFADFKQNVGFDAARRPELEAYFHNWLRLLCDELSVDFDRYANWR